MEIFIPMNGGEVHLGLFTNSKYDPVVCPSGFGILFSVPVWYPTAALIPLTSPEGSPLVID